MDDSNDDNNIKAWEKFLNMIEDRYPACMSSNEKQDVILRNTIVEFLTGAFC